MSEKPDQFVWSSYWRLAWSQRPSTKAVSPLRGLLAAGTAAVQFFYFPTFRVLNEKLTVAVIFAAVNVGLFFVEAAWNFVFVAPVKLDEARRHQAKNDAVKIHCLKSELQETLERMRPKIGFQLKSERQRSGSNGLDTKIPDGPAIRSLLSLDLWNEGPTHVQVTKLELENVSSRQRRTVDVKRCTGTLTAAADH